MRKTVIIPTKEETIKKIKEKYNNPNMTDKNAKKILSLEATNELLKKASLIAGIAFVIDLIVPDPVIGMDEALLGAITAATKTGSEIVENKIEKLANNGNASLQEEEINKIAHSIKNIKDNKKTKSR